MNLEHELRKALRRKDPPHGFDRAVLARIARGDTGRGATGGMRLRFALPIAASVLLTFGAGYYVTSEGRRAARQQAQAERTTHDVSRALQVTSETLEVVRTKLQEMDNERQIQP